MCGAQIDQCHNTYIKYLSATSVHDALRNSIRGSLPLMHVCRIEDELVVCGVESAQD